MEGCDGSGKSTLVQMVSDFLIEHEHGCTVTHHGPPKSQSSALSECIDDEPFGSYVANGDDHIVADRLHWGCPAYGALFRPDYDVDGYGDFGKAGWRYAELFFASRGAVTVLVDIRPETASRRVKERNSENHFTVEEIQKHLAEVIDRYRWIASDSLTIGPHLFEPTMDQLELATESIVLTAVKRQYEASLLKWCPDYIGPTSPDTLVICPPLRETRLELLGALKDDEWQSVGLCSSNHRYDQFDQLMATLNCPKVVGVTPLPSDADAFVYNQRGSRI